MTLWNGPIKSIIVDRIHALLKLLIKNQFLKLLIFELLVEIEVVL